MNWTGSGYTDPGELLCAFTIHGEPKPKGRPRFGRNGTYTPKGTVDAERAVVDAFDLECPLWEPTVETLRVEIDFHRKGKRAADVDNLAKTTLDALNKVAWVDDAQIAHLNLRRFYGAGDNARTVVRIYILED